MCFIGPVGSPGPSFWPKVVFHFYLKIQKKFSADPTPNREGGHPSQYPTLDAPTHLCIAVEVEKVDHAMVIPCVKSRHFPGRL